nr:hypothetical protein Q903MT_gene1542 [Picea sitchensis]
MPMRLLFQLILRLRLKLRILLVLPGPGNCIGISPVEVFLAHQI